MITTVLAVSMMLSAALVAPADPADDSAEAVVRVLYDKLCSPSEATDEQLPDWQAVRTLFLAEAVIVLRSSRTGNTVFDVDGWIADFQAFIERANVKKRGFSERIVRTRTMEFGDIAHVLVLYEASFADTGGVGGGPPQQGVDSIHLARRPEGWKIVSIVNDLPTAQRPLPEALRE
jgi:hypothetical protein